MEVFGILGFSVGSLGFIFGIIGMSAATGVSKLRKEHEALKEELKKSGVLIEGPG